MFKIGDRVIHKGLRGEQNALEVADVSGRMFVDRESLTWRGCGDYELYSVSKHSSIWDCTRGKHPFVNLCGEINLRGHRHTPMYLDECSVLDWSKMAVKSSKKKVVKYPNKFIPFRKLPDYLKSILTDRGKDWDYEYTYSSVDTEYDSISITCRVPQGILIEGRSFLKDGDKIDEEKAERIAAGRLEASLKFYEGLLT